MSNANANDEWRFSIHTLKHILSCEAERIADIADWLASNGYYERHSSMRLTEERLFLAVVIADRLFSPPPVLEALEVPVADTGASRGRPVEWPLKKRFPQNPADDILGYPTDVLAADETAVER